MKKVLGVILGICFVQCLSAQAAVGTYSFIKYEENRLLFDKDSSSFMNFFKKMQEVNGGEIKKTNDRSYWRIACARRNLE